MIDMVIEQCICFFLSSLLELTVMYVQACVQTVYLVAMAMLCYAMMFFALPFEGAFLMLAIHRFCIFARMF